MFFVNKLPIARMPIFERLSFSSLVSGNSDYGHEVFAHSASPNTNNVFVHVCLQHGAQVDAVIVPLYLRVQLFEQQEKVLSIYKCQKEY